MVIITPKSEPKHTSCNAADRVGIYLVGRRRANLSIHKMSKQVNALGLVQVRARVIDKQRQKATNRGGLHRNTRPAPLQPKRAAMPGRVNNNLHQQGLDDCADGSVRQGWPPMGSCVPKAAIVVCSQHLLATVITVIAAAMAILVLPPSIPSDLLPHIAYLPGSASHPPRASGQSVERQQRRSRGSWQ